MSKITSIRTIRLQEIPNILWVEVGTDEGLTGLGEIWRIPSAVEACIHNDTAPFLLGRDSRDIEYISSVLMSPYVGFHNTGAEGRAASAIDIALWDLAGKRWGVPVYEALGGKSRETLEVYNTCSGYFYNSKSASYNQLTSRRSTTGEEEMKGPYDDQVAFMKDAGKLAESLLSEGYKAMKIWPFDQLAVRSGGTFISDEDLQKGLEPFRKIREAVGNRIEVMCELHSGWSIPAATRILKGLEEFDVFWAEDALNKMDDAKALAKLRAKTRTPITGSETICGRVMFNQMLMQEAIDYAMIDIGWCGGLSESRKVADLCAGYNVPVAPHDCTGPVQLWAGIQLSFHASNAMFQEIVRANIATWYRDLVDTMPEISEGRIALPKKPGLGVSLKPEVYERPDAIIRTSSL